MQRMQRNRLLRSWFVAVILAVWTLCVSISLADTPARHFQVTVFSNGLTASPVLEGLQEGLAQLGYVAGKNVTFLVEDTHGAVPDLAQRAARLAATNPDVLVTVGTIHTTATRP